MSDKNCKCGGKCEARKVTITAIILDVAGTEIKLTEEQGRQLYKALAGLFEKETTYVPVPFQQPVPYQPVPYIPYNPPSPWISTPKEQPWITWTCKASGSGDVLPKGTAVTWDSDSGTLFPKELQNQVAHISIDGKPKEGVDTQK